MCWWTPTWRCIRHATPSHAHASVGPPARWRNPGMSSDHPVVRREVPRLPLSGCLPQGGARAPPRALEALSANRTSALQMDLLEHAAVTDVIVPSVVLEEVKARNASVYQRLRQLAAAGAKRFFVFANEHHRQAARPAQALPATLWRGRAAAPTPPGRLAACTRASRHGLLPWQGGRVSWLHRRLW